MVKEGFQFQVCNIINKSVNHFSQFISVEVKKHLRKSEAQVREKLRKLRLKQNDSLLTKKMRKQHENDFCSTELAFMVQTIEHMMNSK